MDKVNKILEKNLSTDKYTIDKLSIDIGMSRTAFYSRIREITGNPPENYIYSFKMDRALKLLASQQYTVSEIAGMLGYCEMCIRDRQAVPQATISFNKFLFISVELLFSNQYIFFSCFGR